MNTSGQELVATPETAERIRSNWSRVGEHVAAACARAARSLSEVSIVGVSKYVGPELAAQLIQAGCHTLGENRPQSLWEKAAYCQAHGLQVAWHQIGHLQRNKLKRTLPLIDCLHSLDSLRLAEAANSEAVSQGLVLETLIEVNVTQDANKTGLPESELPEFLRRAAEMPGLRFRGLMAMSSLGADTATARREFATVRQLREQVLQDLPSEWQFDQLSMGMSGDFAEAIAEGATLVRIGSNLWEGVVGG